ncbi:MAG: hypothetical protein QJR12_16890 [Mycobacterium sp.]|uniref:LamG-like jellyroll fold domain-containing protein n=1 Tax=Mycobacterium sp. TaxID=1785 RepID=UPI002623685B|nr:LamG-like jellyroll fold domain-containing protein [Mycobacterium sp.]MDI3315884.1 hypothetical protein [Mycobacterium sp.]
MASLPTWPLMAVYADFTQGPPNGVGFSAVALNAGPTAVSQITTSRGRQYELNHAEAGTCNIKVEDPSEYLNPANTASPYNSGGNRLLPYRSVQVGAWWSPTTGTTGNLMNGANMPPGSTSPFDPSFESSKGWVGFLGTEPTTALSTAQHVDGAQSLAVTFNTSTDTLAWGLSTVPGQTYTLSMYVFVPAGATVTAEFIEFPNAIGPTIASATSSTTGAWERLTMTGAPTGAVCAVTLTCSTTATTVYLDACQLELGDTATEFTTDGPVYYPIYTGYVERYPQQWQDLGFWGVRPLQCVDALSVLSRTVIRQSYASTVLADHPAAYIPYDDQSFPQTVVLPQGGTPYIGYTQLGSATEASGGSAQGQVNFGGDSFVDGSRAVSVVQQNTSPVTLFDGGMLTYLGTRQGSIALNPQAATLEMWIRFTSGVVYGGAAAMQIGESTVGEVTGPLWGLMIYTSGGRLCWHYIDAAGSTPLWILGGNGWNGVADDQWHHIVLRLLGNNTMQAVIDGYPDGIAEFGFAASGGLAIDNVYMEAQTYFGDPVTKVSMARWALYPYVLSDEQIAAHYQRGIGYLGETTGARATRLLDQYWQGPYAVTDGTVTPMSPDYDYDGRTMLDVLQEISDTDSGLTYVTAGGAVTVEGRDTRYRQQTARWVFGEREDLGELPYVDLAFDYDPTYVYSEVQASIPNGTTYDVVNQDAQQAYGQRILSTTLHAATDWYAEQYAQAYAERYGQARVRVNKITIDPSANPALWPAALGAEISQRVTVNRRAPGGATISQDYYIEQIKHSIDSKSLKWTVDLQLSPVFVDTAWILGDSTYGVLGETTVCVY